MTRESIVDGWFSLLAELGYGADNIWLSMAGGACGKGAGSQAVDTVG